VRREKRSWTAGAVRWHFFVRGSVLVVLARLVNMECVVPFYAPRIGGGGSGQLPMKMPGSKLLFPFLGIFEVLTALGLGLIIAGMILPLLTHLRRTTLSLGSAIEANAGSCLASVLGLACFAASNATIVHYQAGNATTTGSSAMPEFGYPATSFVDVMTRFLLIPGMIGTGVVVYPAVPWVGLTFVGIAVGYTFATDAALGYRICAWASPICLGLFVLIRQWGGVYGNLRGWPRGDTGAGHAIEFFNVCKYPPSVAYALLTTGVNLALLTTFRHCEEAAGIEDQGVSRHASAADLPWWWRKIVDRLRIFGEVPLFLFHE